jgi:hypothetical protein
MSDEVPTMSDPQFQASRPDLKRKRPTEQPATWAIVELMGHVRLAGRLSEEEKFGAKMGRLDIPSPPAKPRLDCMACKGTGQVDGMPCPMLDCDPQYVTQYFGGGSVYRITIVSEAVARHAAKSTQPEPVQAWDFPKQPRCLECGQLSIQCECENLRSAP